MAKAPTYNPDSVSDAQTAGIRHIGIGTCSSGKMREYLRKKGFNGSVINEAVSELIRDSYKPADGSTYVDDVDIDDDDQGESDDDILGIDM